MKKKTKIIIFTLCAIILITVAFQTAYSLWSRNFTQSDENIVYLDCFDVTMTDSGKIDLDGTFPLSVKEGLSLRPYTVTVKNNCETPITINISLEIDSKSTLEENYINVAIEKDYNLLKNMKSVNPTLSGYSKAYLVKTDSMLQKNEIRSYDIRLWVDENTTTAQGANKTFTSKTVVTAVPYISGTVVPKLASGMIPVYYKDGKTYVTVMNEDWFDYNAHEWANAILVDSSKRSKYVNTNGAFKQDVEVDIANDVLQMYVWIPRFKYRLFNVNHDGQSVANEQMIEVEFVSKNETNLVGKLENQYQNGEWYVHPAFTFGSQELEGFWVAKFETSGTFAKPTSKPNAVSISSVTDETATIGKMFESSLHIKDNSAYGLNSTEVDTHLLKNMEWGAITYLTQSKYGIYWNEVECSNKECEVWKNNVYNNGTTISGCSGKVIGDTSYHSDKCRADREWNKLGVTASTTQNMYGVYDMVGGDNEYVMGNIANASTLFPDTNNMTYGSSTFTKFNYDSKYVDMYSYNESLSNFSIGKLGDATKETQKIKNSDSGSWNSDYSQLPTPSEPWFMRGGRADTQNPYAGLFYVNHKEGNAFQNISYRNVLTTNEEPKEKIILTKGTGLNNSANTLATAQIGDIVNIGDERFYVISNNNGKVRALAEYNLLVGNSCTGATSGSCTPITNPTGIQSSTALGRHYAKGTTTYEYPSVGVIDFSASQYWTAEEDVALNNTNNKIYQYLINYKNYLNKLSGKISNILLITKSETDSLGCNETATNCNSAPKWVYNTAYWVGTSSNNAGNLNYLWYVGQVGSYNRAQNSSTQIYSFGIRPVIEFDESSIYAKDKDKAILSS